MFPREVDYVAGVSVCLRECFKHNENGKVIRHCKTLLTKGKSENCFRFVYFANVDQLNKSLDMFRRAEQYQVFCKLYSHENSLYENETRTNFDQLVDE